MPEEPIIPVQLVKVMHESEAGLIISTLASHGIEAQSTGDYTSGLRAEAPTMIQVWVNRVDLIEARQILATIKEDSSQIDWGEVDTGDRTELTSDEIQANQDTES